MRLKIPILPAVILLCACPAFAQYTVSTANVAPANPWGDYSREAILTTLETNHDLWLEAELAGHRDQASRIEKDLLGLLNCDIYAHQERVRQLAKDLILSPTSQADTADGRTDADSLSRQLVFRTEISALNAKEALHRSIVKTDAFSNKYRLLGDYIDLLRRELEMPRLKLASSKAPLPADSKNPSTVSPREDNP
jgi:hypothetical protein